VCSSNCKINRMSNKVYYANLCTFAERNFLENSIPTLKAKSHWKSNLFLWEKMSARYRYNRSKQYC
jgi:hypothetical protein